MSSTLIDDLAGRARPAVLHERTADGHVRCTACAHRCVIAEGRSGTCGVRFTRGGQLHSPSGYVARTYVRPVETNTVYHVLPGASALTFGMFGCDLRCGYCQNWNISQALREGRDEERPREATADGIAEAAVESGCRVVCAAYNEPMIAAEWVREVFAASRARGLRTIIVTDGNTTPEALDHVAPVTDVFRVDLKGSTNEQYRTLGGRLAPVPKAIEGARARGLWVEVVTLVVPGFNDSLASLRSLADLLVAIDPAIPWHLNAFQPRYRMLDRPSTDASLLVSAAGMAYARGARYVYVGNVHRSLAQLEHTRCPRCHDVVVERADYIATSVRVTDGACPSCGEAIPGLWR